MKLVLPYLRLVISEPLAQFDETLTFGKRHVRFGDEAPTQVHLAELVLGHCHIVKELF